jgi:hypothetical protein
MEAHGLALRSERTVVRKGLGQIIGPDAWAKVERLAAANEIEVTEVVRRFVVAGVKLFPGLASEAGRQLVADVEGRVHADET